MTGVTMIFFYLGLYLFWKEEILSKPGHSNDFPSIHRKINVFDSIAYISVVSRIILILLPWNNWGSEPKYFNNFWNFRLITNLPLYVIGFEVLTLFMVTLFRYKDTQKIHPDLIKAIKNSVLWIAVSFITYTITILGVHSYPILGMFMIPKTIAYLLVLFYMSKYVLGNPKVLSEIPVLKTPNDTPKL